MFAVTGITGNVGGVVAQTLLAGNQTVRAIVRDRGKGVVWADLGCEIAVADINDAPALRAALQGIEGVFAMVPPNFDPAPGFPEARAIGETLRSALDIARPARVVYLSTIGAQATHENLLSQHTIIEGALRDLSIPITFLRPGWFMENSMWDVAPARDRGIVQSFLQPLDKPVPMVCTTDIGRLAAELLQQASSGQRVVELEGPHRVTPNQIGAIFAELLGHEVKTEVVPRDSWEPLFRSQGMQNPLPRIQMLDGFNEGSIEFEAGESGSRKGSTTIAAVLKTLIER
jgi:NAD(P)H dehydrogenase (quinone)